MKLAPTIDSQYDYNGLSIRYELRFSVHHDAWNDFVGQREKVVNVKLLSGQHGLPE